MLIISLLFDDIVAEYIEIFADVEMQILAPLLKA